MIDRFEMVPFHQHQIMTVKTDSAVFVVMKPVVEALGLTWHGQYERMNRHPVIRRGIRVTRIPSAGGMQEAVTLDLEQFHGWLVTLVPDRVRDDAKREIIIRYQSEAFRVVFEHFHGKIGAAPQTAKSIAATISIQNQALRLARKLQSVSHPTERRMMHQMLDALCQEIGIDTPLLEDLGHDQPAPPDLLGRFWMLFDQMEADGIPVNRHRKKGMIALSLPEIREMFSERGVTFRFDRDFRDALGKSKDPLFIGQGTVNSRDGTTRHCWIFQESHRAGERELLN